ncbi:flagellar protein FlaG, partial [Candidatus Hydrogenedentota bacterium]
LRKDFPYLLPPFALAVLPREELVDPEKLRSVVNSFESMITSLNTKISIDFDEESGDQITYLVDKESGEVVRQFPPEEMIEIGNRLREFVGVLLDVTI